MKIFVNQIIVIFLLCLCISIAISCVVAKNLESNYYNNAKNFSSTISARLNYVSKEYDEFFLFNVLDSEIFAKHLNNNNEYEAISERKFLSYYYHISVLKKTIRSIYAYTNNQNLYYAGPAKSYQITNKNNVVYKYLNKNCKNIQEQFNGGRWIILPGNQSSIYYVRSIYNDYIFNYQGIFVCEFDSKIFFDPIIKQENQMKGDFAVFNQTDDIIYNKEKYINIFNDEPITTTDNFNKISMNGEKYTTFVDIDEDQGWKVVYFIQEHELYHEIYKIIRIIIFVSIAFLTLALFLNFFILSGICSGLKMLTNNINEIQQGNFKLHINTKRNDEVGKLATAFNHMSEKLDGLVDSLAIERAENEKIKFEALKAEYSKLIAQINPHFLYNILESINSYAKNKGQNEIALIVQKLGAMMRFSISSKCDTIRLSDELLYTKNYLKIYEFMLEDRLNVIFDIHPSVENMMVPKLILQPIVENAIKHSAEIYEKESIIAVTAYRNDEMLMINISDNGCGMSLETIERIKQDKMKQSKSTHLGIKSVDKRIKILYGDEYGLDITSYIDEGTVVTVKLPLIDNESTVKT